jgi:hypothetical protein
MQATFTVRYSFFRTQQPYLRVHSLHHGVQFVCPYIWLICRLGFWNTFQRQYCFGLSLAASHLRHVCFWVNAEPHTSCDPQQRTEPCYSYSLRRRVTVLQVRELDSPGSRAHQVYSVICTVNLVLTIMIIRAREGLKNIAAQYAHLRICSDFVCLQYNVHRLELMWVFIVNQE